MLELQTFDSCTNSAGRPGILHYRMATWVPLYGCGYMRDATAKNSIICSLCTSQLNPWEGGGGTWPGNTVLLLNNA